MIKGWKKSTLGEACHIEKGKASAANEPAGMYPLVTTGEGRKSAATWQFEGPAVCVPMISAFGHGKPGLKRVHYQEGKFALANILSVLLVKNQKTLSAKFLSVFLNFYKDQLIVPLQYGAANMSVTVERLATVPIWFPTLDEQERILGLIDEVETLRVARIRADTRMEQFVPALFQEMIGDDKKKEKEWTKISFGEITVIDAKIVDPRKPEYCDLIHIGPEHIEKETGKLLPARTAKEDGLISSNYLFDQGHVLYSKIRPYLKKAALPNFSGLCSADMYPIKPDTSKINREFLWAMLLSKDFSEYAISVSRRANMPKINREQLSAYQTFLPPLALQREFAVRVEAARGVQSAQGRSAERIEALYQSMLSRAFAGEL